MPRDYSYIYIEPPLFLLMQYLAYYHSLYRINYFFSFKISIYLFLVFLEPYLLFGQVT